MKQSLHLRNSLLYLLIALGFGLRLFHLDRQSLWFDEIVITSLAKLPLRPGLEGLLQQGIQLTPFDHWIIKLWSVVGESDWLVRYPAVFFSLLGIPLMYQLGKSYFAHAVGLFAAALITINPFHIWYAQEARGYSLLTMSAMGAMIAFYDLLQNKSKSTAIRLSIFNILGFGTHYFMFLIPAVQFAFILLNFKKYYIHLRAWLLIHILSASILIPWFVLILTRRQFTAGIGWIPKPIPLDLLLTIWNLTIGYKEDVTFPLAISLLAIALSLILGFIGLKQFKPLNQLVLIWFFLPLITIWILSQSRTSFYVDRYFMVIMPALISLLSIGVTTVTNQMLKTGLGLALLLVTTYGLSQIYFNPTYFTKDNWREMARILRQEAQPGDGLVTCADGYRLALDYYDLGELFNAQAQAQEVYFAYPAETDFNTVLSKYRRLWVVVSNPRKPQHHLGYSYPPILNPTVLPAKEQSWLIQHPPKILKVSGITTYLYSLADTPP